MNKYSLRFYLNIFCLSLTFLSVLPLNAQTYTRLLDEGTNANAIIEWDLTGVGITPDPVSTDYKLYNNGADLGSSAIEVVTVAATSNYTIRVDLSKVSGLLPYNVLALRTSGDVDLTTATTQNYQVQTVVTGNAEKYFNDNGSTLEWTYKRIYDADELDETDLKLYINNNDEGYSNLSVTIDNSGQEYTISADLSAYSDLEAGDIFKLTDAADNEISTSENYYYLFDVTHPNNQEFNSEETIEWTLKGSFVTPYPTSSNFTLFQNSSDEGSDELSVIEITAGEEYLIRADVSSFSPITDGDEFKLEGLNNGDLTGTDYTYIFDGTDPTISFALSSSSDTGYDNSDGITNKTSLFFDITTEFGSSIVVEDGSNNVLATSTSTGTNTLYISSISEGSYTLKVIVTDLAGNEKEFFYPLVVDETPITQQPTVPAITSSYNTGLDDANVATSVTGDIEVTVDDLTTEAVKVYVISDIKGNVGEESLSSDDPKVFNIRLEDEGTHQLTTYVEDAAGNVTQSASAVPFIIDSVTPNKPQIVLKSSTQSGREESGVFYTSNPDPVFEVTVDEADIKIDLLGEKDTNPPTVSNDIVNSSVNGLNELTSSNLTVDGDGTYYYQVTIYDKANNSITSDVITVAYAAEIDPLPIAGVTVSINNSLDASSTYTNNPNVELKFENVPNNTPEYELVILDESFVEITRISIDETDEYYTLSSLADGVHKVNYHFEDVYGNRNPNTEFEFTVDTQVPSLTTVELFSNYGGNSSLATTTGDQVSLKIVADETLKNTSSMTINGGTPITAVTDDFTGSETIVDFSSYQNISFSVTAIDLAGNQTTVSATTDGSEVYIFPDIDNTIQNNDDSEHCGTSSSFTLANLTSTGGKGSDYTYEWYRKTGAGSFENLNSNGAEYTEYQELTPETYIYRRVLYSEGESVNADLTINVYNELTNNSLSYSGQTTFWGASIAGNTIQLTGSTPANGNGSTYSYEWEKSTDNSSWNPIGSETGISLDYADAITDETTYFRRKVTSGPCESYSNSIQVNLYPNIVNSIKTDDAIEYCEVNNSFTIESDVVLSGGDTNYDIDWELNKDDAGFSSLGIDTEDYTNSGTLSSGKYVYRRVVTSAGSTVNSTTDITIYVYDAITNNSLSYSGQTIFFGTEISGNTIQLTGSTPADGNGSTYSYVWEKSTDNSSWNPIGSETGISLDYADAITDETTYFRRKVTSGPCESYSNSVQVNLYPNIVNSIKTDDAIEYCEVNSSFTIESDAALSGGDTNYDIDWELNKDDAGFNSLGVDTENYTDNGTLSSGKYVYRRVVTSAGSAVNSATDITIHVYDAITNNSLSYSGQTIFFGTEISGNTIQLTGSTPADGNGSTYSYVWEKSTDNTNWNTIGSETGVSLDYADAITDETTYFRRKVTSGPCESYSNVIMVNLYTDITNTISYSGPSFYCEASPVFLIEDNVLSGGDGNYTITWERKMDSGSFTDLGVSTSYYTESANLPEGEYTYKRVVTSAGKTVESSEIDIVVYDELINNTISLQNATNTFFNATIAGGTIIINESGAAPSGGDNSTINYSWEISTNGSTWTPIGGELSKDLTYASAISNSVTYFRRKVTSGSCDSYSNEIQILRYPIVTNTISYSGVDEFCGTNEVFTINEGVALTGGDNSYTIEWQRKKDSGSYATLNVSAADYTENESLTTGVYKYRRVVTSGGEEHYGNEITISVADAITNTIPTPGTTTYVGEIAANTFTFTPAATTGGFPPYVYDWQYWNGSSWVSNGTDPDYTHDQVVAANSIVKIRRIITSGGCSDTSNEITITALPDLENEVELSGASEYCETFASFEIKDKTLSGADGSYTISWYRSSDGSNYSLLGGENKGYYIEDDALSAGQYSYKRRVVSAGETVESTPIVVDIYSVITENSITASSSVIFFNSVAINTIQINTDQATAGGDGSYNYLWEIDKNDGNGYVSTSITTENLTYDQALSTIGEYKFRRKVNSVDCSDDYSNEITVNVYNDITNFGTTVLSGTELCEGGTVIISGKIPEGGDGSYTYKWYRENITEGTPIEDTGVTDVNYIENDVDDIGVIEYTREVTSAGQTKSRTKTITIIGEPATLTISPIAGSNYSNSADNIIPTSIDETDDYYCTGSGIVSNGLGKDKNHFYPALAGEGDHTIEFHIVDGSCEFVRTVDVKVYDGSKVFSTVNGAYCQDGLTSSVTYNRGDYENDNINVDDSYESIKYKTTAIVLEDENGDEVLKYHDESNPEVTTLIFEVDPEVIIDAMSVNEGDVTKLVFLKIYYENIDALDTENFGKVFSFSQGIDITLKPSKPEVNNNNPQYCFKENTISPMKVTGAIGTVYWFDGDDNPIATGTSYTPILGTDIIKDENNNVDYKYYVKQEVNGCLSDTTEIWINLFKETDLPTFADDIEICEGDGIPVLEVTSGSNITWYNESEEVVGTGEKYTPIIQTEGLSSNLDYKFFATSTENDCESKKTEIKVRVNRRPSLPEFDGPFTDSYCEGETNLQDLVVKKQTGETFEWYKDESLTDKVDGNDTEILDLGNDPATVGTFNYWVVKVTPNDCKSNALKITYNVYEKPEAPTVRNQTFSLCKNDASQDIEVLNPTGTVFWFENDPTLNDYATPLTGNDETFNPNYNTNVNSDEVYTYYVAQKNANDCFGPATAITVNVYDLPEKPSIVTSVADREVCSGSSLPQVEVSGTTIRWYSDNALTKLVGSGTTFDPNESYDVLTNTTVSYYVISESVNGCISEPQKVDFEIKALPNKPVANFIKDYCEGFAIEPLVVTGESGATFNWYDSEDLSNEVGTTNTYDTQKNAPAVTEIDSLYYWVTQTVNNCTSLPQKVSIPIIPTPESPTLTQTEFFYCNEEVIAEIEAVGTNVTWYSNEELSSIVSNTNDYTPSITNNQADDETKTFYVTQKNTQGCESEAVVVTVTRYKETDHPVVEQELMKYCAGDDLAPIIVTEGENVKWYSDEDLTNSVGVGNIFIPKDDTYVIIDTSIKYYVTQFKNGCESEGKEVEILIYGLPVLPVAESVDDYCEDDPIQPLRVSGEMGATFKWYDNEALTNKIGEGEELDLNITAPAFDELDSLHYWVTQTSIEGCTSFPKKVSIPVYPTPAVPTLAATEYFYCNGDQVQPINATGENITWYRTSNLESIVTTGEQLVPIVISNQFEDVTKTFYVTQKNDKDCESEAVAVTITIYKETEVPAVDNTFIPYCSGETIQPIVLTDGENLKWYSDEALTNNVGSGKVFLPGSGDDEAVDVNVSVDTSIDYYVTETINGCESEAVKVELYIYALPSKPVAEAIDDYCEDETIQPLTVSGETGATFKWYDSEGLDNLIGSENTIDLGITAPAFEELDSLHYWVTQTSTEGCTSLPQKVSVPVYPTPAKPTLAQTEYFYCNEDELKNITASGNDITWYRNEDLSNIVTAGAELTPVLTPNEEEEVSITYYVTQKNDKGCESEVVAVTITIYPKTLSPTVENDEIEYCSGESIQPIVLTDGENLKWYSDEDLSDQVGTGKIFLPSDDTNVTEDTEIKYYVTETLNGCESEAEEVEIKIYALPAQPVAGAIADYCEDEAIQPLTATGETGATFKWYDSEALENLLGEGSEIDLEITAPAFEELDSLHYWVTQTSTEGCTSLPQKVSIPVYPTPAKPTLTQTEYFYCNDATLETITASGSNISWYSSSDLSELLSEGTSMTPSIESNDTLNVVETYYVTQKNDKGCESEAVAVSVTIYKETEVPVVVADTIEYCSEETLQPIIISGGENIKWYSDSELSTLVNTGNIFLPEDNSTVSTDTSIDYYVTETKNGCESEAQRVDIIIYAKPNQPVASSVSSYCEGDVIAPLSATGEAGALFKWYDSEALDNLLGEGSEIDLNITAPAFEELDSLHYWVTQTSTEGCISLPQKVSIPVYPTPSIPTLSQSTFEYCNGETILPVDAEGTNITWYSDAELTQVFSTGTTLIPPPSTVKDEDYNLTYYVTQKNENLCEGEAVEVSITVYKETIAPTPDKTVIEYCSQDVLQPLVVTGGENVRWYEDGTLSEQIATGNSYLPTDNTNVSEDTSIDYYFTETKNGCESTPQRFEILIYKTPDAPLINGGNTVNYCSGETIQPLIVTGQIEDLKWYSDAGLSNLVWEGNEFTPNDATETVEGSTISYYVTNSHKSCESSATEVKINLHPLPVIELLGIAENEIFCKSDVNPIVIASPSNGQLTSSTGAIIRNNNEILLGTSSLGDHIVKYTYVNNNNCVDSVLRHFTIVDVPKVSFSEIILCDAKEVIFYDETLIASSDSLTKITKWEYDFGEGEGSVTLNSAEEASEYTHVFNSRGEKNITLTITTNQNCSEISFEKTIVINSPPKVDFTWMVSEFGKEMIFEENIVNADGDNVIAHHWDFGDGTESSEIDPKHRYNSVGTFNVTYTVTTEKGCSNIIEKEVFVLPHPQLLTDDDTYFENFDLNNGNWTAIGTSSSWEYGIPVTTKFNSTNNAWVTGLDSTYLENEESYLYLPSFDISGLSKPMLSFDMNLDVEEGIDGLIMQYSLDSGQNWYLLGDIEDPINWYNSQNILSDPGDQIIGNNTLSKGWTGTNTSLGEVESEYFSVRHQLDNFIGEEHLRLRFVFKANSAQEYEGVVIDNFFIGNRKKVVLLESMTNAGLEAGNRAMNDLGEAISKMSSDVLGINYHIYLENYSDDLNKDKPEPSSGRKFFYGVTNAPRTIVDGGGNGSFIGNTNDFLETYETFVYERTLLDPEFSISTDLSSLGETGQIEISLTAHKEFDAEDTEIVVHVVTIEKEIFGIEITDDITSHLNVMKSMSPAPGAEGTSFFGRSWKANSTETVYVDWDNPAVYETDNVELIVFVQDNKSKEIYQAMNVPVPSNLLDKDIVSSIDDLENSEWTLYPNPASTFVNIRTNGFVSRGTWELSNINGQKVKEGTFDGDQYKIDVQGLPSGIYMIRNSVNGEYISDPLKFVITK